jgi:hypothetical protein
VLTLIALLTSFGLAILDDLVAVTVGTKHGHADYTSSFRKRCECGIQVCESANLKQNLNTQGQGGQV